MNKRPDDLTNASDRKRLLGIALFIFCLLALLILQFYKIQITEGDFWTTQGEKQHFFYVKEPPLRGNFFSNTSLKRFHPEMPQKFVMDIPKFHLFIDPESIPEQNRPAISEKLIAI